MAYNHRWCESGESIGFPLGKVVCVGRNYAAHAEELGNPIPDEPVLFIKPGSCSVSAEGDVLLRTDLGVIHYEAELAVLIGKPLSQADEKQAKEAIAGLGIGLDLTLREVQSTLKQKQLPWERAKAFDGSCVLSGFVPVWPDINYARLNYSLNINGIRKQTGQTEMMLYPVLSLIAHISQTFSLQPGDVVLTGTPEGVGIISAGDRFELALEGKILATGCCISA
ncbi:fumarylacetoacetate hydrolase family protein [Parasalinivibrio latis]|uniref:fumarylacetoacetate hydrolase family protein n=1 Tax=Parasalinivibrio latis TaxID=2952610 RepID=UPI0030E3443E